MLTAVEQRILVLCDEAGAFAKRGRFGEAIGCYREAIALSADIPELHKNLGDAFRNAGQVAFAISAYRRAIDQRPSYASALNNLGLAYFDVGHYYLAAKCYQLALKSDPGLIGTFANLRKCVSKLDSMEEVIPFHLEYLEQWPGSAHAHLSLGFCYARSKDFKHAELAFLSAIALDPELPGAHEALADILSVIGRIDRAIELYRNDIEAGSPQPRLLYKFAFHGGFKKTDLPLAKLEQQIRNLSAVNTEDQVYIRYALSKALEDVQRYEESFYHLRLGAALKRSTVSYDEAGESARSHRLQCAFSPELIMSKKDWGHEFSQPLFIVGMPRSGSTLLEQVLASHHEIATVGESNEFALVVGRAKDLEYRTLTNIDREALLAAGTAYLDRIRAGTSSKTYIVDKTLSNFSCVGLIHLMFPKAKILHIVRSPLDACFSCFATLFDEGHGYSYDLRELGRCYRQYMITMQYWGAVVPDSALIDVKYENFVSNVESATKVILHKLGLDWDEKCLEFYESGRPVHTASLVQVRQPVYKRSIGRSVRYKDMLGPLQDELQVGQ